MERFSFQKKQSHGFICFTHLQHLGCPSTNECLVDFLVHLHFCYLQASNPRKSCKMDVFKRHQCKLHLYKWFACKFSSKSNLIKFEQVLTKPPLKFTWWSWDPPNRRAWQARSQQYDHDHDEADDFGADQQTFGSEVVTKTFRGHAARLVFCFWLQPAQVIEALNS